MQVQFDQWIFFFFSRIQFIEVEQGDIFMEQKMIFGLVLGQLAIMKKKMGTDYEQFLRVVFSCFQGQKNIVASSLKSCIK